MLSPAGPGSHSFQLALHMEFASDDPDRLPLPSPLLLNIRSRFSNSLQWSSIEDRIRAGWPTRKWKLFTLPQKLRNFPF